MSFLDSFDDMSNTTRIGSGYQISDIIAIRSRDCTRSDYLCDSDLLSIDIDTLMYVLNFADDRGFAFVAADRRTEPIWALVENGNFDISNLSESEKEVFGLFLELAIHME